ncbi:MAG: Spy/CpxP family protein refolding chaperone [Pyrinomonadaceae bacterium]
MKTIKHFKLLFLISAALVFVVPVIAQDTKPAEPPPPAVERLPLILPPRNLGPSTLKQLGLTDEQMQQIRKLKNLTLRLEASKRLREATRLLDEAIYADYADEADIQNKLQKLHEAQAEVARLKYMNELAVRRLLTQEQLIRFRELRQRYDEMQKERVKQRLDEFKRKLPRRQVTPLPQTFVRPVREKPVL